MTKKEKKASYNKAYKEANKEKIAAYNKAYGEANKEKIAATRKTYYKANKKKLNVKSKAYNEANKKKLIDYNKAYKEANKEKIAVRMKAYREANKEKITKTISDWSREKRKTDPIYKLKVSLRSNVLQSFKRKGFTKNSKTFEILGCDYDTFEKHIADKFSEGMSLDNHGQWHLDHQIPLALAETEEEVVELCHYTNYQPLWDKDNLVKKDKVRLENISFTNKARYIKFLNRV